jgi:hypothetical protein
MTSERKLAANRVNAKRSTGPRTARGKSRASQNALRHGLATVSLPNPASLPFIERMAKAICGDGATRLQYEQALNIAESEYIILMVRAARVTAIKRKMRPAPKEQEMHLGQLPHENKTAQTQSEEQPAPEMYDEVAAFQHALPEMTKYDRYERRALSRRLRAIRTFVASSILGAATPAVLPVTGAKSPPSKTEGKNKP